MKFRLLNMLDLLLVTQGMRDDEIEQARLMGFSGFDAMVNFAYNVQGNKWAWVDESDTALVVGGYIPKRPGVFSTWFWVTNDAWKHHGRAVTEMAIERQQYMFDGGAHRLETVCLSTRKLAHRWYKTIGSTYESTLKGYCIDGSDAMMFADVRVPNVQR